MCKDIQLGSHLSKAVAHKYAHIGELPFEHYVRSIISLSMTNDVQPFQKTPLPMDMLGMRYVKPDIHKV